MKTGWARLAEIANEENAGWCPGGGYRWLHPHDIAKRLHLEIKATNEEIDAALARLDEMKAIWEEQVPPAPSYPGGSPEDWESYREARAILEAKFADPTTPEGRLLVFHKSGGKGTRQV